MRFSKKLKKMLLLFTFIILMILVCSCSKRKKATEMVEEYGLNETVSKEENKETTIESINNNYTELMNEKEIKVETLSLYEIISSESSMKKNIATSSIVISTISETNSERLTTNEELTGFDDNNHLSTGSTIKNIINEIIDSEDTVATNSNVASQSSIISTSSYIKGDYDIYGNLIEYDPELWVGEDYVIDDSINVKNIFSLQSNNDYGVLDISLAKDFNLDKSNILVSLVDEAYNINNIYVYYRNEYHEKIDISVGKYRINTIKYLMNDDIKLISDINEFSIEKDEVINIHLSQEERAEIISSESITENEKVEIEEEKKTIPIYIYIIVIIAIILLIAGLVFLIKIIRDRKDEQ